MSICRPSRTDGRNSLSDETQNSIGVAVPLGRQEVSGNRTIGTLLDTLMARDYAGLGSTQIANLESSSMIKVSMNSTSNLAMASMMEQLPSQMMQAESLAESQGTTAWNVFGCIQTLETLDRAAVGLSVKTNWAYWRLGKAYEAFCLVSHLESTMFSIMVQNFSQKHAVFEANRRSNAFVTLSLVFISVSG